jgi:hypothetical protein
MQTIIRVVSISSQFYRFQAKRKILTGCLLQFSPSAARQPSPQLQFRLH